MFIQGFYLGSGLMPAILFDQGMETDPTACDYITVELYEGLNPSNPAVSSTTTILHTDGTAQITLPAGTGTASFKFTRGTWATVEGNSAGGFIPNRTFTYSPNLNLNLSIAGW